MIFRGRRSGIIHNFTMDVNPGYKYIEKFRGGIQWYMLQSRDIISSICFILKNENNQLVSFNGQNITFDYQSKKYENYSRWIHTKICVLIQKYTHIYNSIYTSMKIM